MRLELEALRLREKLQTAALARLAEQVEQAGRMQRRLLDSQVPTIKGAELFAFSRAAETVAGDFHELARIDDRRVAIMIGDATGHGLAAGMLSTLIKGALGGRRRTGATHWASNPVEVMSALNRDLLECSLHDCEFVTAVYAVYDELTRELTWSRGGAPYPVLLRTGGAVEVFASGGMTLGVEEQVQFETSRITLAPGETIVFHTDGLDAALAENEVVSSGIGPRQREWFDRMRRLGPAQSFETLRCRLDELDATQWRADDVTAVSLRVID